jgi:DNA-binding IclR family transcriptional regulator
MSRRKISRSNITGSTGKDVPEGKRRGINSVEIGMKILDAITDLGQPASLTDISNRVGMGVSQTHRYVSSFLNCGILRQEPNSTLYILGPKALQIGLSAIAASDPISLTDIMARQFSIENRATILMAVWGNNGPTIIRWYHGQPPIYTILTIGSVLPVTYSATGRMFLAHLPEGFIEPMLKDEGWKTPLGKNPKLIKDREKILKNGVANVDSTVVPGLRAFAVPVFGLDNQLIAVLSLIASDQIDKSKDKKWTTELKIRCQELSIELGAIKV